MPVITDEMMNSVFSEMLSDQVDKDDKHIEGCPVCQFAEANEQVIARTAISLITGGIIDPFHSCKFLLYIGIKIGRRLELQEMEKKLAK